jgi:hypothetical protein
MPRDRQRLTLESGPKLDPAKLIPSGAGKPGRHIQCVLTYGSGETITAILKLFEYGGLLEVTFQGRHQSFSLVSKPRHFGGLQWYVICSKTGRRVRVLYRPLGAAFFASRHAWGRRAAYVSQLLDPIGRAGVAHKGESQSSPSRERGSGRMGPAAQAKGHALGHIRAAVAKYDAAEEMLNVQLVMAAARLMKRL